MKSDFETIDESDFDDLADQGVIGPYPNDFLCIGYVIEDRKPIAMVDEDVAQYAAMYSFKYNAGLYVSEIPNYFAKQGNHAVYKNPVYFHDLCRALLINGTSRVHSALFQAMELGKILGYSDADIAKYIQYNYSFKIMKNVLSKWRLERVNGDYLILAKSADFLLVGG